MSTLNHHRFLGFSSVILLFVLLALTACGPAALVGEEQNTNSLNEALSNTDTLDRSADSAMDSGQEGEDSTRPTDQQTETGDVQETSADTNRLEIDESTVELDYAGVKVGFTTDGHPFRGDPDAPIVIKEYSDYQCPFCARFVNDTLPSLIENQVANGEAVLVYYDFPLSNIHPQAAAAANAARCAGEQSSAAYWAMHDALFGNPGQWGNATADTAFSNYAEKIGLEMASFESCLSEGKYDPQVQADLDSGVELGVDGTPTFFINGQSLVGAQPLAVFDNAIATIKNGGQLASAEPADQPAAAPTPAALKEEFAGAMGDPDAPVTIVEFTDYQCPYCSRHSLETMPTIIEEMVQTGRVYYILKDLPLDQLHPNARTAAAAARCAGLQEAYWEMHDLIFTNQAEWADVDSEIISMFTGYAADLGLDEADFDRCLGSGQFDEAVQANASEAQALGVDGTPFFFVNGYPLNGARPIEHFQLAVQYAEEGRLAEAYAPRESEQQQPQQPTGPQEVNIGDSYSIGETTAPITIVEYTDYQCPYCSRHYSQTFPQIVSEYVDTGLVRYVFKDFPLNSIHPQAQKAAEAARCAGEQGEYLQMHNILFERQQEWSNNQASEMFAGYADELNLDSATFSECLSSGKYEAAVTANLQEGVELGVTGTPAFFINGYPVSGAQPYTFFDQAFQGLLAEIEGS